MRIEGGVNFMRLVFEVLGMFVGIGCVRSGVEEDKGGLSMNGRNF